MNKTGLAKRNMGQHSDKKICLYVFLRTSGWQTRTRQGLTINRHIRGESRPFEEISPNGEGGNLVQMY